MRTYQQAQAPAEVHHRRRNRGQAGAAAAATLAPPAGERTLLSSGTEDYFLGTYYFNRGMFHSQSRLSLAVAHATPSLERAVM